MADESPPPRIEELPNQKQRAASVGIECGGSEVRGEVEFDGDGDGIGGAGVEMDASGAVVKGAEAESDGETQIVASSEVEIDHGDDNAVTNESECVKGEGDVKSSDVGGGSELPSELDVDKLDSDVKLETVAAAEDYGVNDAVEEKRESEKNLAACGDMEMIDEASKMVEGENGDKNVAGNSDLSGMVVEDCHTKDAVEEKREKFEENLAAEQSMVMTSCGDMEQVDQSSEKVKEEDGEENAAGGSDLIGMGIEDCHMDTAAEEKGEEFEKNLAVERCAVVTAVGGMDQIDESRNTLKEEEVVDENVAGNSDLVGLVTEDSHVNDSVEEKGEEFEKKLAVEQCAVMTAIGDVDQMVESKNTLKEEEVVDENVAGNSELVCVVTEDSHMNDVVEENGEEFEKKLAAEQCAVVATIGDMDQIDESRNKLKEKVGEEDVAGDSEMIGVELTGDYIDESDNIENEGGDGDEDEEMGSEEENTENKEKLEEDVEFSLQNVVLDTTTGEDDEEFVGGEEQSIADAEIETQIDTPDAEKSNTRPKRGRKPSKVALTKKTEEDVCFICFDGGDLVVCDRR